MIFVDTSAWLALADRTDKYHQQAVILRNLLLEQPVSWITSSFVIGETYTLIQRAVGNRSAQKFIGMARTWSRLECVSVTRKLELTAEDLLTTFADQDFSYVDAISFALMRDLGISSAFAFDHHFSVAGFTLVSQ